MPKVKSKSSTRGRTKTRPIRGKVLVVVDGKNYSVPRSIVPQLEKQLRPHRLQEEGETADDALTSEVFFSDEHGQYPQWATNLRGLRYRENLTQIEFADKIGVSQSNLSAMENGRRPIGKEIAGRIGAAFAVDYRHFL